MPSINAQVEAISIKEMPSPDKYGNSHRANIKVGEDWFSYGALKKPQINIKSGGDWHELQKGMEVEFMYDVNGDFKNIKKQSFTITNVESATSTPTPKPKNTGTSSTANKDFVNPAALGNAGNYLMHSLEFKHEDMMDDDKILEGLVKYHKSREQLARFWEKAEALAKEEKPPFKADKEEDTYDDEDI